MKKSIFLICALSLVVTTALGQGTRNIKINEVLTNNANSLQDEYGTRGAWVEVANTAFSTYNLRGMYITTDRRVLDKSLSVPERTAMMSCIPGGDSRTALSAREHLVFFLNGNPAQGTLHINAEAESGEPVCDLMFGGGVDSIEVYSDYLEPYVSPETERIPELYLSSDGIWTPFSVLPVVMIYNTKLIDDGAITAWRDLMRPGYRGKIAFADPSVSGSSFTALVTLLQALGGDPDEELLAFAENLGGLELDSSGDVLTAVANGSCWIGITLEETALKRRDAGDSIELAYPEDGTSLVPDGTAIVRGSRHLENARRFIDFTVSRDVQQLLTVQYRRPVRTDVALGSLPEVEQLSVLDYDIPWASEHHDEVLMSWAFYLDREERP